MWHKCILSLDVVILVNLSTRAKEKRNNVLNVYALSITRILCLNSKMVRQNILLKHIKCIYRNGKLQEIKLENGYFEMNKRQMSTIERETADLTCGSWMKPAHLYHFLKLKAFMFLLKPLFIYSNRSVQFHLVRQGKTKRRTKCCTKGFEMLAVFSGYFLKSIEVSQLQLGATSHAWFASSAQYTLRLTQRKMANVTTWKIVENLKPKCVKMNKINDTPQTQRRR